jgi:predicted nucleic acid-binding protein
VKGFLLDTNIPSELTYPRPAPQVAQWLKNADNEVLFFSVISLAEICKGIAKLPESKKRAQLQEWLDSTLRPWFAGRILPVTEPIAERMGRWAAKAKRADGPSRLPTASSPPPRWSTI